MALWSDSTAQTVRLTSPGPCTGPLSSILGEDVHIKLRQAGACVLCDSGTLVRLSGENRVYYNAFSMAQRMAQFQAAKPNVLVCLATEVESQDLERERQARFRHLHIRGEWFRRDITLMQFLETIQPHRIFA